MKQRKQWYTPLLFALLALSLQSCLGLGGGSGNGNNFQTKTTSNGKSIGINNTNQAIFKGKIYFTLNRNLYVLDGQRNITQLTHGMDVRDPAVSPDGKWIAFVARYKDYSNLMLMPASGGGARVLRSGNGTYVSNNPYPPNATYLWYAQPAWAPDSQHLLFLSDYDKSIFSPGVNAFLLDLQILSISINDPTAKPQDVAYASYGDGGLRDPSYRPGHPNQIIFTDYKYDTSQTRQLIQIYFEDATAIANNPGKYRPGVAAIEVDPAIPLTPATPDLANMEPAWSPDGNSIAYIRRIDASHMGLFIMPVPAHASTITNTPNDPTIQQQALQAYQKSSLILSGQYVSQPVWSPDGKQIAYISYTNQVFDIWLVSVQQDPKTGAYSMKGSPVQLTDAGGQLDADSRPFWTP